MKCLDEKVDGVEKEHMLMHLLQTTIRFAQFKHSNQVYQKHRQLFGVQRSIDFLVNELLRGQLRAEKLD